MPPPTQIAIATSSLNRLVKEESSYHTEAKHQEASIAKLEQGGGDENAEYQLRQEVRLDSLFDIHDLFCVILPNRFSFGHVLQAKS